MQSTTIRCPSVHPPRMAGETQRKVEGSEERGRKNNNSRAGRDEESISGFTGFSNVFEAGVVVLRVLASDSELEDLSG